MCFVRRRSRARSGSSLRREPSWSCSSKEPAKARPGGAQLILPDRFLWLAQPEIPDCQSKPARRRIREGPGRKRGLASRATWQPAYPTSSRWFCASRKGSSADWPCWKIPPFQLPGNTIFRFPDDLRCFTGRRQELRCYPKFAATQHRARDAPVLRSGRKPDARPPARPGSSRGGTPAGDSAPQTS